MPQPITSAVVLMSLMVFPVACVQAAAKEQLVPAGGDLQAALDAARPGDTILLEPGATYVGNFRLPVHGGTEHVTIRSAADDALLPAEDERITPASARHLPKIKSPNTQPAIATAPGAAYWRLMFLELQATRQGYFDIVTLGDGSGEQRSLAQVPHELVLDRVYIHGDPLHGQKRGVALNSASTSIRNSYIADIKAIGQDSLAVGGWNGPGPYLIENNYLEAAGEVFMLGGADPAIPNLVPADVVFRRNTVTRPLAWREPILAAPATLTATPGSGGALPAGEHVYRVVALRPAYDTTAFSPASSPVAVRTQAGAQVAVQWAAVPDATEYRVYVTEPGGASRYVTVAETSFTDTGRNRSEQGKPPAPTRWQVKNLLELKNARRVQIADNTFDHNWEHAQSGVAILFTPRNQDGRCEWCVVEDVTFERNVVRGTGGGITILGYDNEHQSQQTNNIRILHNLFVDLSRRWGGSAYFLYVFGNPRDIVVDHNTIISPDGAGVVNVDGPPVQGFVFTNNVARHNEYGIIGRDEGPGSGTISRYFPGAVFEGNVFAGASEHRYPKGIEFVSIDRFESQFMNYSGGDFRIKSESAWSRAASDGSPLGAVISLPELARGTTPGP